MIIKVTKIIIETEDERKIQKNLKALNNKFNKEKPKKKIKE